VLTPELLRDSQKGLHLTRTAPVRQDAPFLRQGRSKRRGEEVHTALRVSRSPIELILVNRETPPVRFFLRVEPLSDARTPLAEFFSILSESALSDQCRDRLIPGSLRHAGPLALDLNMADDGLLDGRVCLIDLEPHAID